ncbi:6-phosphogluconate dehydrogenase [Flavobacteriaceae bacterium MAR_2010_188]|nr:6-phosphogluconate dehydrogenase [Flavobacteriaceae bacterium MAR_2010_188]
MKMKKSEFGIIGLGVMGGNLALNVLDSDISLSVYNRSAGSEADVVSDFLEENSKYSHLKGFTNLETFVESLKAPRKILIMIKAGAAIDSVIDQLKPFLESEDILIDGGNSYYLDTERRIAYLQESNIYFIGCGISGGAEGARRGPSMMPGGPKIAYDKLGHILERISAKDAAGNPCCTYIGPGGAGHYVKMIHNGIEYAEMQLLAEIYSILRLTLPYEAIQTIFESWNSSNLKSFLLEISTAILGAKENDSFVLDQILDKSGNKGTGFWSVRSGLELGLPTTMMSSALYARFLSAFKEDRVAYSKKLAKPYKNYTKRNIDDVKSSYEFARIINHHQGFEILREASEIHNWNLDLGEIARIWTNGCIIRSSLMEKLSDIFKTGNSILTEESFIQTLKTSEEKISNFIKLSMADRIPVDCFWSAYNYWVSITTENLPANLIQAQRDFFGGHTYQRIDRPSEEFFHFNWTD